MKNITNFNIKADGLGFITVSLLGKDTVMVADINGDAVLFSVNEFLAVNISDNIKVVGDKLVVFGIPLTGITADDIFDVIDFINQAKIFIKDNIPFGVGKV